MERWLPVILEELGCDSVDEIGARTECGIEVRGEAAFGFGSDQHRPGWVVLPRAPLEIRIQLVELWNLPQAVRLQVPKWVLRVKALSWRAEFSEEFLEALVQLLEQRQSWFAPLETCERVEEQQRLVRRALVPSSPEVEVGEAFEELSIGRFGVGAAHDNIMAAIGRSRLSGLSQETGCIASRIRLGHHHGLAVGYRLKRALRVSYR